MTAVVTAIVPCMMNSDRPFVREAVLSIHGQSEPCDVIVVVEKSNDWIEQTLSGIPEVRILRCPLSQCGTTRNAGVAEARTEYVAFLDADDVWMPTKTAIQLAFLRSHSADFVGVDHILMREDGTLFAYGMAKYIPMPSAWMVRRDYMLHYPFSDEPVSEDWVWWLDPHNSTTKHRIAEPLIRYRVRNVSLSSTHSTKRRKLLFANLSRMPVARPLLLLGSYIVRHFHRRTFYVPLSETGKPSF